MSTALPAWETVAYRDIADCHIFEVTMKRCRHPIRNIEAEFAVLKCPEWVQAIAITEDKQLVMVNQYRFGKEQFSWEIPGGIMEKDEDPIVGAQRELAEETGYTSSQIKIIGQSSPNPAFQDNTVHFVLLENCVKNTAIEWDEHEEVEVALYDLEEVHRMACDGRIHNSVTYNSLYFLEQALK